MIKLFSRALLLLLLALTACQAKPSPSPTVIPSPTSTVTRTLHPIPTQIPSGTPSPQPTYTITPGPSPTGTPQPSLAAYTWQPQSVLVIAGTRDLDARTPFGVAINFMLLADGQLIVRNCNQDVCTYKTSQLDRLQVCSLLNSIDQAGFFDYDASSYHSPQPGTHNVFIQVNAWRNLSIELDQLDRWLADPTWLADQLKCANCVTSPVIPPALSNTYYLLNYFRTQKMEDYRPQAMAVWLTAPWIQGKQAPWTLESPSLSELLDRSRCSGSDQSQAVILQGDEANRVSDYVTRMLSAGYSPVFTDGQLVLQVTTQWLLPFQSPASCPAGAEQATPAPSATPLPTIHCDPSDGLVPVITPTLSH